MGVTVVDYHGQRKLCGQFKLLFKGFDLLFTGRKIIVIVESDFDCDYLFILGKPFYFEQGSVAIPLPCADESPQPHIQSRTSQKAQSKILRSEG